MECQALVTPKNTKKKNIRISSAADVMGASRVKEIDTLQRAEHSKLKDSASQF